MPEEGRETLKKALPGFMNKESPLDAVGQNVPVWATIIAAAAVISFVVYAIYTLGKTMADENETDAKQKKKRADRAAKKGNAASAPPAGEDNERSVLREWAKWIFEQATGVIRDLLIFALLAVIITEGSRYMPRAEVVPCDAVLGDSSGGSCVTAPGLEEPLKCDAASKIRPTLGALPTREEHAARACHRSVPAGILKKSSHRYYWDSAGGTWTQQGWLASLFYQPWANDRFVLEDKLGGVHSVIVPKSFEDRIRAFYTKYNPETLSEGTKVDNLVAKYQNNPDQETRDKFEASTFAALHAKYKTGAMGSVVSPLKGSIDAAGAVVGKYQYVGRIRTWSDRANCLLVDVLPDLRWGFTTGDY